MEVLKSNMKRRIVCDECNSLLEYDNTDVYHTKNNYHYLLCPICNNVIIVKNKYGERQYKW